MAALATSSGGMPINGDDVRELGRSSGDPVEDELIRANKIDMTTAAPYFHATR